MNKKQAQACYQGYKERGVTCAGCHFQYKCGLFSRNSGIGKSQRNARAKRRDDAKAQADKIYRFTLSEAEAYAEAANDLVSLIMVANLKYNGWYACKIDGVKIFFTN